MRREPNWPVLGGAIVGCAAIVISLTITVTGVEILPRSYWVDLSWTILLLLFWLNLIGSAAFLTKGWPAPTLVAISGLLVLLAKYLTQRPEKSEFISLLIFAVSAIGGLLFIYATILVSRSQSLSLDLWKRPPS